MKNGYILLTQVMMDLQRMRGRIIQVGQRLNGSRDFASNSNAEITDGNEEV